MFSNKNDHFYKDLTLVENVYSTEIRLILSPLYPTNVPNDHESPTILKVHSVTRLSDVCSRPKAYVTMRVEEVCIYRCCMLVVVCNYGCGRSLHLPRLHVGQAVP